MQLTLFRGATALLYLGPLFAGLGGAGWAFVPWFFVVFLTYLFIVRRSLFPRQIGDLAKSSVLVPLLGQALSQLLLIMICFAIGRGLGGILGVTLAISPIWALSLSFLAIPLCRWLAIQPMPDDVRPKH